MVESVLVVMAGPHPSNWKRAEIRSDVVPIAEQTPVEIRRDGDTTSLPLS
jgi:hypothetical protein